MRFASSPVAHFSRVAPWHPGPVPRRLHRLRRPVRAAATFSSSRSISSGTTRSASPDIRSRARPSSMLAREGVRYRRAHVQNVVCMPSRATMLTGQHPLTHGVVLHDPACRRRRLRAGRWKPGEPHRAARRTSIRTSTCCCASPRIGARPSATTHPGAASITSSSPRTARSAAIITRRGSMSITPRTSPASAPCSPAPAAARPVPRRLRTTPSRARITTRTGSPTGPSRGCARSTRSRRSFAG